MSYEKEIVNILLLAGGRGLPVRKIAHHVHHEVNSLFEQVSYERVYADVRRCIYNDSRSSCPLFKHTPQYGCYRVNKSSEKFREKYQSSETYVG